jgi:hypothetical protein
MSLPILKNPQTTYQAIGGFALVLIVVALGLYFHLSDGIVAILATVVSGLMTTFLGFSAADASTTQALATDMATQLDAGLTAAKLDYTALHEKNAKVIAVHDTELALVKPVVTALLPAVVQVKVPADLPSQVAEPSSTSGHLVTD